MSKKNLIIVIVLLVIVVAGGVFWMLRNNNTSTNNNATNTSSSSSGQGMVITYSDSGFSPSTVTTHAGDKVTIKNTSSEDMQFDSDPHPVHTNDPELNVGVVVPGSSKTFTVNTKGTHGYHNHLDPGDKGTIVVE